MKTSLSVPFPAKLCFTFGLAIALQITGCSQSQTSSAKPSSTDTNRNSLTTTQLNSAEASPANTNQNSPNTTQPNSAEASSANTNQNSPNITQPNSAESEALASKLQQITQIPVLLPSAVLVEGQMYFNGTASRDRYEVSFDHTKDCHGVTACNFGGISAQQGREIEPISDETQNPSNTVEPVTLANGTPAQYSNQCGAYCTASVAWKSNAVRYGVFIKNGLKPDVLALANSVQTFSSPNVEPFAGGVGTLTTSQDYNTPINIRTEASTTAKIRHIGYAGDEVTLLARRTGSDKAYWYQVKFPKSGATGWVRGDFVSIDLQS
ncbi:MAG: SH3 domain-containing protein [Myxacorys chilensis ATA2-1-KO14]|jgi:hypothetical protein|nr:SH3 domain-containing protein [Myxacorys chilensis ATA2-1-KO14]